MIRKNLLLWILLLNSLGIIFYIHFYVNHNFLPYPFVYDKNDTFMDFFNPMWRLWDLGRYKVWKSVYPPLNYIFLKWICSVTTCEYMSSSFDLRSYSNAIYAYFVMYCTLPLFVINTGPWRHFGKSEKVILYLLYITAAPMLFMLERGNLILIAPLLISLTLATTSGIKRALYIAVLANLKPYFIVFTLFFVAKKQWSNMIVSVFLMLTIFIISSLLFDQNAFLIFRNILDYGLKNPIHSARELISFPSSISVFFEMLNTVNGGAASKDFFGAFYESFELVVKLFHYLVFLLVAVAFFALLKKGIYLRDEIVLFILSLIICNSGTSVGGYSTVIYLSFIPLFLRLGREDFLYYFLFAFILLNYDYFSIMHRSGDPQYSYLYGAEVETFWNLGVSGLLRPLSNFILIFYVLYQILKEKSEINAS